MDRKYQQIIDDIKISEFYKCLELENVHLSRGLCEMYLPIRDHMLNCFGEVDQTVLYTAVDAASLAVARTLVTTEEIPVNNSMNISVLSMVPSPGGLKIVARAIESELDGFIEIEISNDHCDLVTVGNTRFKGLKTKK